MKINKHYISIKNLLLPTLSAILVSGGVELFKFILKTESLVINGILIGAIVWLAVFIIVLYLNNNQKKENGQQGRKYQIPYTPEFNYTILENIQIMEFISREKIKYTRKVKYGNIKESKASFPYCWSGDYIENIRLSEISSLEYEIIELKTEKRNVKDLKTKKKIMKEVFKNEGKYSIRPLKGVFKNESEHEIIFDLIDTHNKMNPELTLEIPRPNKKITFKIIMPKNIKATEFKLEKYTEIGDKRVTSIPEINNDNPVKCDDSTTNNFKTYVCEIENPELYYSYSLTWKWT